MTMQKDFSEWIDTSKIVIDDSVSNAIKKLISTLRDEEWGLNFGSGETKIHGKILNLDIYDCTGIDIIATGTKLPFKNDCLGVALTQEVLEHVADPFAVIQEIWHVLKPDGLFYCQVPFQIGYHPGPEDYWRFTEGALKFLFENDRWTIEDLGISVGHGSGFYRIFVEFLAVSFSCLHNSLYMPAKGIAAVILVPLKLFDLLTPLSKNWARIPGGFYCVARKKS